MPYFTWKLKFISNILWMIVGWRIREAKISKLFPLSQVDSLIHIICIERGKQIQISVEWICHKWKIQCLYPIACIKGIIAKNKQYIITASQIMML